MGGTRVTGVVSVGFRLWMLDSGVRAGVIAVALDAAVGSWSARPGLAEAGAFDGVPGAEESAEAGLVADQPDGDRAGPADDHGWDQDGAVQEAAELHPDVVPPVRLAVHHHREPGLEVPGQRG